MAPTIQIVSNDALCQEYRRLLAADWDRGTLDLVVTLLWDEISTQRRSTKFAHLDRLNPRSSQPSQTEWTNLLLAELRQFRHFFRENEFIPPVPDHLPVGKLAVKAEMVSAYLILQSLADLRGETGFFADTQSLLFLVALDQLLPAVERSADTRPRDCLLNAFSMHTFVVWSQTPQRQAHHFYLQAALMDALGQPQHRAASLRFAVNLTNLEDHSFLTKAQAYTFSLQEAGQADEARRFVMNLYRYAPERYLPELQEMLDAVQERVLVNGRGR